MGLFSRYATVTHTTLGCTNTSQTAVAANNDRKYLLLINDSDAAIYVKFGATAVVNEGIRLNANGGTFEASEAFGNLPKTSVTAITAAATKVLLITEAK